MEPTPRQVTKLLQRWHQGDAVALITLIPLVHDDLRRLANYNLKQEAHAPTLQSTALVHEVYLRFSNQEGPQWDSRVHFLQWPPI